MNLGIIHILTKFCTKSTAQHLCCWRISSSSWGEKNPQSSFFEEDAWVVLLPCSETWHEIRRRCLSCGGRLLKFRRPSDMISVIHWSRMTEWWCFVFDISWLLIVDSWLDLGFWPFAEWNRRTCEICHLWMCLIYKLPSTHVQVAKNARSISTAKPWCSIPLRAYLILDGCFIYESESEKQCISREDGCLPLKFESRTGAL